jgi:hypothetical protein
VASLSSLKNKRWNNHKESHPQNVPPSLLQKLFIVSVSNLFSISASLADTIYTIPKIAYLFPANTKNRFFFLKRKQPSQT